MVDSLFMRVLHKSSINNAEERILTRSELYETVENVTRVSISRVHLERILAKSADTTPLHQSVGGSNSEVPWLLPSWFVNSSEVPVPKSRIARPRIESNLTAKLKSHGICWLFGSSGVGKSTVARSVLQNLLQSIHWIDLRSTDSKETSERLHQTLSFLSTFQRVGLIIEDLNCSEEPTAQTSLSRVLEAARRQNFLVVVTSYKKPAPSSLNNLGLDIDCVLPCESFNEEETETLIAKMGGDPKRWGTLAFSLGGQGHPLLVHAVASQLASNNWLEGELEKTLEICLSPSDVNIEKEATTRKLISTLPESARDLLYRLSLITHHFNRELMHAIGLVSPTISRTSEHFDQLVGPWFELLNGDKYRASPLIRGVGRTMLTRDGQRQIHHAIANHIIERVPLSPIELDSALYHGLAGDAQDCLLKLSSFVNLADHETRSAVTDRLTVFRSLDLKNPIYKKHPHTSVLLRLAQLRVVASSHDHTSLDEIAESLLGEINSTASLKDDSTLEFIVVSSILNIFGIANQLSSWVRLLSRFQALVPINDRVFKPSEDMPEVFSAALLFNIGIAELDRVAKLAVIFDHLNNLTTADRTELLTSIDSKFADYKFIIQNPMTTELQGRDFDSTSIVGSYLRMARQANEWGNIKLSLQCAATAASICNEHLQDEEKALQILQDATKVSKSDPIIVLAFAGLHFHNERYQEALEYYRNAQGYIEVGNPVDAIYTLRQAAISAANCKEFDQSKSWFLLAQRFAKAQTGVELHAIGIGLGADAAVASFEVGEIEDMIELLQDALIELSELDPQQNLQSAYCHRIVRHSILWLKAQIGSDDIQVEGEPITMSHGVCSNPNPSREVWQLRLGHIDIAWYLLAELDVVTSSNVGVADTLSEKISGEQLPLMEFEHRLKVVEMDIHKLEPNEFCVHFADYLSARVYIENNSDRLKDSLIALNPTRENIPPLEFTKSSNHVLDPHALRTILSFGFKCLFSGEREKFFVLGNLLDSTFDGIYPGSTIFRTADVTKWNCNDLDKRLGEILFQCFSSEEVPPMLLLEVGVRFFEWGRQSVFAPSLMSDLARWLRGKWLQVLKSQSLSLADSKESVGPIKDILNSESDGQSFVALLSILVCDVFDVKLESSLHEQMSKMVTKFPEFE